MSHSLNTINAPKQRKVPEYLEALLCTWTPEMKEANKELIFLRAVSLALRKSK